MNTNNSGAQAFSMTKVQLPTIKELGGREWVEYGDKNNFPSYLIDLTNNSAAHNAAVTGIAQLVYGRGLTSSQKTRQLSQWTRIERLFGAEKENHLKRFVSDFILHGNAFLQVTFSKAKQPLLVDVLPAETIRMDKVDEEGVINGVWYSADWDNYRKKQNKPEFIEKYNEDDNSGVKVIMARNMRSGQFYYGQPDYIAGLTWIELDKRIANFHLNNIANGLFPSMHFGFKNGVPPIEEQRRITQSLKDKFGEDGDSEKIITTFTSGEEAVTIDTIETSNADQKYQFLSTEVSKKILVAHKVVNSMIFGIKDATGFGNNAEELKNSFQLFDNMVIQPKQQDILRALEPIFKAMEVNIPISFGTLEPIEFREEAIEDTEPAKFSTQEDDFSPHQEDTWLEHLASKGEINNDDEWELISEEVADSLEEEEEFAKSLNFFEQYAAPEEKSEQDKGLFKIRYSYAPQKTGNGKTKTSRKFCIEMVAASKAGIIYRKEDIDTMTARGENSKFAAKGEKTYDIFQFKGGVNCHHFWTRKVFKRKRDKGKFLPNDGLDNDKSVSANQARKEGVPIKRNEKNVAKLPIDMPNGGRLN